MMVRWSAEHKAKTREEILKTASQVFREQGFEAVSVANLMGLSGLTHGGFYAHFRSKDDLVKETLKYSFNEAHNRISRQAEEDSSQSYVESLVKRYLSPEHRENVKFGCTVAALGCDIARLDSKTRKELSSKLDEWIDSYRKLGAGDEALVMVCAMVGAMQIARIYEDKAKSDKFLAKIRRQILKIFSKSS